MMAGHELLNAANVMIVDAGGNLATCVKSLNDARDASGGVPNAEVVELVKAQAALAQALAVLALAKAYA